MNRPVAIVTGARRGIGRAIALALAEAGFDLIVADLKSSEPSPILTELSDLGAEARFVAFDLAEIRSHEAVLDAAGEQLQVLVNNAGIGSPVRGDLLGLTPEHFDRVIAVNLRGTLFLAQAAAKRMLAQRVPRAGRAIVNVTSVSAERASPERADYCASKAALAMVTKALALRLAPERIAVFEVRPGIIRTAMTQAVEAAYDACIQDGLVPARRWGEPEDVGRAVAGLVSGGFGFATGSVVNVDGALAVPSL
ncbi:MAG: 3-ketoacyl-ACP reductase [Pseudomonadota bacterium]